jgi:DNA-directed RNA polymerase subunit RPC12/RpoP
MKNDTEPANAGITCPSCAAAMTTVTLEGHSGTAVVIDACAACQGFWFDRHESLRLSPASTLKLFTFIGEHASKGKPQAPDVARCPRCRSRLLLTHDRQRSTPFRYWRCDREHGRFITFFDFLREKDFVRPLSPQQLKELRQNLHTLNCSNCGAPIDLGSRSSCAQCGSPISMLDMKQAERLVAQLRQASEPKPIDPALALELERARLQTDAAFASVPGHEWWREASSSGLVEAGLTVVAKWFKRWEG